MVNNLNAEALRNALVVASMEYCKKYLEGQNVDKTEDIKAQIAKLEANGLGRTKNAEEIPYSHVYLLVCTKCGKFKQVKMKPG